MIARNHSTLSNTMCMFFSYPVCMFFLVTQCVCFFSYPVCIFLSNLLCMFCGRVHDEFKSRPRNRKHVWWRPCCLEKTVHFAGTNESIPLLKRHENTKSYWETSSIYVSWNGRLSLHAFIFYTPRNEVRGGGGYIGFTLSVRLSVCLSVTLSCPPCSIYSSGWILSIFGTND